MKVKVPVGYMIENKEDFISALEATKNGKPLIIMFSESDPHWLQ